MSAQASKERLVGSPSKCRRTGSPPRNSSINAVAELPSTGFAGILYEVDRIGTRWCVGKRKGVRGGAVQIGKLEQLVWSDRGLVRGGPRSPAVRGVAWGV